MPVEKICLFCAEDFTIRKKNQRYCSNECKYSAKRKPKVKKICEHCEKPFEVIPSLKRLKYCNRKCSAKAQRKKWIKITCQSCGKTKEASPSRKDQKYCSYNCYQQAKRERRIKITCQSCGKQFEVHPAKAKTIGRYKPRYCSRICQTKARALKAPKVEKICITCGKKFCVIWSRRNIRKYCSKICSYLDNKENILKRRLNNQFQKGLKPWNKGLTREDSDIINQIANKRTGQKRPDMSAFMKNQKYWEDDKYLFNIFKGQMFGKDFILELNEADKEIIRTKVQIFKLKKEEVRQHESR